MSRERALLALTVAAVLVTIPVTPGPLRAVVAAAFLLVAPGLAWTPRLPVHGPVEHLTAAVALSLALDAVIAEVLLLFGAPGLFPAVLVLSAVTVTGVALTPRPAATP